MARIKDVTRWQYHNANFRDACGLFGLRAEYAGSRRGYADTAFGERGLAVALAFVETMGEVPF